MKSSIIVLKSDMTYESYKELPIKFKLDDKILLLSNDGRYSLIMINKCNISTILDIIKDAVSHFFNIEDIFSKSKKHEEHIARRMFWVLAREIANISFNEIHKYEAKHSKYPRLRSTINIGVIRFNDELSVDKKLRDKYQTLKEVILNILIYTEYEKF